VVAQNKSDVLKTRIAIFLIGSLVVAFLSAVIFIFMIAQQPDTPNALATSESQQNNSKTTEKWH
jgi:hypothetical protein